MLEYELHALNIEFFQVMARVDEVLHNLDQLNLCVSLIRQTGAYHRRFQGFKPKYFKVFHYHIITHFRVLSGLISSNSVFSMFLWRIDCFLEIICWFSDSFVNQVFVWPTQLGSKYIFV